MAIGDAEEEEGGAGSGELSSRDGATVPGKPRIVSDDVRAVSGDPDGGVEPRRTVAREILAIAWPSIGTGFVLLGHSWIDMAWVARVDDGTGGRSAVAAVAVASFYVWILQALGALLAVGLSALIARYLGAGRPDAARYTASQGLRGTIWLAACAFVVGVLGAPLAFQLAGSPGDVAEQGIPYVRIAWGTGLSLLLVQASAAIFRAHGQTRVPFLVSFAGLLVNAVIDPLLIFGWGGLPALGVPGSAWATAIAQFASAGLLVASLRRHALVSPVRPADDRLRLRAGTPLGRPGRIGIDWTLQRRLVRVGLPIAGSSVLFAWIYTVVARYAALAGGAAAQAGLGIGHRGEAPAWIVGVAFGGAASTLVGRDLGASEPARAERAAWIAAAQCAVICGFWALALSLFDQPLAALFSEDPLSRQYGASYYRITATCLVFQGLELTLEGAFGGAGSTVPPMLISASWTLLRVPLAWWVVRRGGGVDAIWWVLAGTAIARGLVLAAWFRRGAWKTREI